jgi:5-(carboxyamino)imidazole ribonucleotide mutase
MKMSEKKTVAVIVGSQSDLEIMQGCFDTLEEFGIEHVVKVLSAHRSPALLDEFIASAPKSGIKVIIAAAGAAAHLAGAIAGRTILPVIGVPLPSSDLKGLDSLLATVQMPGGIPVATMAIGKAGAKNAAIFAAQILAVSTPEIAAKMQEHKAGLERGIVKANEALLSKKSK